MGGDGSVTLDVANEAPALRSWSYNVEPWRPLCRVDGWLQAAGGKESLRLLRLQVRTPAPIEAEALHELREESALACGIIKARLRKLDGDKPTWLKTLQARLAEPAPADEGTDRDRRRQEIARGVLVLMGEIDRHFFDRTLHDPYGPTIGFWTGLSALLPEQAGPTLPQRLRDSILEDFDDCLGAEWQEMASVLDQELRLRLTVTRIAALREHLAAALSGKPKVRELTPIEPINPAPSAFATNGRLLGPGIRTGRRSQ
jgi:hypothetical protein